MKAKTREGAARLGGIAGQIDALRIAFDTGLIAPQHPVAQVGHLVHPTALVARARRDRFGCGRHARANKDKGKGNGNGNDYDDGEGQRATREGERMRDSSVY